MSKHRHDQPPLFEEVVDLASCRAYALPDKDSATLTLAEYTDVTPPAVIHSGLALRTTPDTSRFAVVPLGGRRIIWSGGIADEENPVYAKPQDTPLELGLIGGEQALDVEIDIAADRASMRGWTRPRPTPLTMPDLPQNIDLPDSVEAAVCRALDHGGIGVLVGIGLLVRFGGPRLQDLLAGADTVGAWARSAIAGLDEDAVRDGSHLASTAAVAFAQTVQRLDDTIDPESAGWRADLVDALRQRDDLCSAARVLRKLDLAEELDAILTQADAWIVTWLDSLPFHPSLDDEHLAEVALRENPYWARRAWLDEA